MPERQSHGASVSYVLAHPAGPWPLMRDTHAWSEPVSVRMAPSATKTGMVEIEVRRVDA